MNPLTVEWVKKAEADWNTAQRELATIETPNYDAVCFHAHSCAEKYLKARLVEAKIDFPKTHDLALLLELLRPVEPDWQRLSSELNSLSDCAVEIRYPGYSADCQEARQAVAIAGEVRQIVRKTFQLWNL